MVEFEPFTPYAYFFLSAVFDDVDRKILKIHRSWSKDSRTDSLFILTNSHDKLNLFQRMSVKRSVLRGKFIT